MRFSAIVWASAVLLMASGGAAQALGPGCNPDSASVDPVGYVEDLLETPDPDIDFTLHVPVCMTDIHPDLERAIIRCDVYSARGVADNYDHQIAISDGSSRPVDIDQLIEIDVRLPDNVQPSSIRRFECRLELRPSYDGRYVEHYPGDEGWVGNWADRDYCEDVGTWQDELCRRRDLPARPVIEAAVPLPEEENCADPVFPNCIVTVEDCSPSEGADCAEPDGQGE